MNARWRSVAFALTNQVVGAGAQHVMGDPDRLEQALQNLAANALRHTPDGGEIQLAANSDNGRVQISVRDTGTCIRTRAPAIHLRSASTRWTRRAKRLAQRPRLSIVKAIVEASRRKYPGREPPRRRAVFTITLPSLANN
jgi:two-component system sensor histidine kinase BaeS